MTTAMTAPRLTGHATVAGQPASVVTSRSHAGTQVWLVVNGTCECPGFRYRGHCAHVDVVRQQGVNLASFRTFLVALVAAGYRAEAARQAAFDWLMDNCASWL